MIDETLLEELIEENKIKQKFDLIEFNSEMQNKWDDDKYYFDINESNKIYKYISLLKNDKGTSRKFVILKFQFQIISEILCIKRRKDNLRRFREAHINVGRKNSKSFLVGIIMSYIFFHQKNIFGALFIITGNTTKQASELFNTFKAFVNSNKALKRRCKIVDSRKEIVRRDNGNKLLVLSNDGGGADSYSVYSFACDEIHEYKSDEIYGKLKTGSGQWDEPLAITLTTASSGEDPNNLEMQLYTASKSIEKGEGVDETFYYKIYEAEKDCEIDDIKQWFKANPALGLFNKADGIMNLCKRVALMPLQENMFRRMFLNQHVATNHIDKAINMDLWYQCVQDIKIEDFKGMKCWGGLDLSSTNDITGLVLVFYNEETDKYYVFPFLFTARDTIIERETKDKNPYSKWVRDNELIALDGKYVNFPEVLETMLELKNEYEIKNIGYDRWGSTTIKNVLDDEFGVVPLGQGTGTMNTYIKDFENLLIDDRLVIAKNSLFDFMANNVVATYNANMDIKYNKQRSKFIIDGIIAMIMAIGLAVEECETTHYDPFAELEKLSDEW